MVKRFPYTLVPSNRDRKTLLRPQLELKLTYKTHTHSVMGLLDSGADVNVMPFAAGIALGAVWDEQTTAVELSGNLAHYEARGIIVSASVWEFEPVQLVFAWTKAENVPLILGQVNFFMEFDICFFRSQNAFEIQPK